jgi:hypothetical protein
VGLGFELKALQLLYHFTPHPFLLQLFFRVLHVFAQGSLDGSPLTHASHIAGITGVHHHNPAFLLIRRFTNFLLGLDSN